MTLRALRLPLLLASAAACVPAMAAAQAVTTARPAASGISQEQALALSARLDALERRNTELEAEVAGLKAQVGQGAKTLADTPKVSTTDGRTQIASRDGDFTFAPRAVMQFDAALYDQARPGPLASDFRRGSLGDAAEADHARDLSDGTNLRRARLGFSGKAFGAWEYNFLYDFGGSGVEEPGRIVSAWVEYGGLKPFRLRLGAVAPGMASLDDATSANNTLFLERASAAELVRSLASGDGRTGAALYANGQRWFVAGAVTGNAIGVQTFDEQLAFIGRAAFVPWRSGASLAHLGVNATVVTDPAASGPDVAPAGAARPLRLRERPEMRVDGARLVDTGSIDASGLTSLGIEAALLHRNLSLQGEYFRIRVERRASPLADPKFSGGYVQGAWTITGEARRYNAAAASLDLPKPARPFDLKTGGWGAWELAARYALLDLNFEAGAPGTAPTLAAIRGGRQATYTLGLNWYPNAVLRVMANYQRVEIDRLSPGGTAFGAGVLTPPAGAQIGQNLDIWSLRTQYAF